MPVRAGADKKTTQPVTGGATAQRRLSQSHRGSTGEVRDDEQEVGNMPTNFMNDPNFYGRADDQLKLTDAELNEEHTRILTARNPQAPENIVRFSHKEHMYKLIPHVDQLAVHFQLDGTLIHKDSDEAKRQALHAFGEHRTQETESASAVGGEQPSAKEGEEDDEDKAKTAGAGGKTKKLTNQFNFSERASQTYNNPCRDRETIVEQTPRAPFSDNVSQWSIFDAYAEDFEQQQKIKEKENKKIMLKKDDERKKKFAVVEQHGTDDMTKFTRSKTATISLKILERMINQNTFDDIAQGNVVDPLIIEQCNKGVEFLQ